MEVVWFSGGGGGRLCGAVLSQVSVFTAYHKPAQAGTGSTVPLFAVQELLSTSARGGGGCELSARLPASTATTNKR